MTTSRLDVSGRSPIGRVARLSRNVRQPNRFIGDQIAGHEVEWRSGAGEEWFATTKHDGAEVESILIDKTGLGQASRQGLPSPRLRMRAPKIVHGRGPDAFGR
jgi:hypothetical protein